MSSDEGQDITTLIDRMAHFVSKKGLEFEEKFLAMDTKFSFLRSSDPLHGIYQQKLSEYQNAPDSDDEVAATDDTQIIKPPPDSIITALIEGTAHYVSKWGVKEEKLMMTSVKYNPNLNFLRKSDPYHAFYKRRLAEYRSQNPQEEDPIHSDDDEGASGDSTRPVIQSQPIYLPHLLDFQLPIGMTLEEFDTIKLTAQFVAWYGGCFLLGLIKRGGIPQSEFMKPTDRWFSCFSEFVVEYAKVLKPPADLKQELSNSPAYTAAILDAFLQRLEWDPDQHYEWRMQGVKAMTDWHASVTKDFADKDKDQDQEIP